MNQKSKSQNQNNARRRLARFKAVQALYQQDMTDGDIGTVITDFHETQEMDRVDIEYFELLFRGVLLNVTELDEKILPLLDRKIDELDTIERAILRLSCYELIHRLDVPYKVVINEAVDLAKKFGADQSHKYINGVMDKLAVDIRSTEANHANK